MRTVLLVLVSVSLVMLGGASVAAADSAATEHLVIHYENNTAIIDFCTGEEVSLSGRATVIRQRVVNDNRVVEVRIEKFMLEGLSAAGETVRLHTEIHSTSSQALGGGIELQQGAIHSLTFVRLKIGNKPVIDDDYTGRTTFHAVVDANGDLRRWEATFEESCQ